MVEHKDEKFISIDFETWENKYKPMEQELESLKWELENNKVRVAIELEQYWRHHYNEALGFISISARGGEVSELNKSTILSRVSQIIESARGYKVMSKEEAREINNDLHKISAKMDAIRESNEAKIIGIPKIARWLFGIKKV